MEPGQMRRLAKADQTEVAALQWGDVQRFHRPNQVVKVAAMNAQRAQAISFGQHKEDQGRVELEAGAEVANLGHLADGLDADQVANQAVLGHAQVVDLLQIGAASGDLARPADLRLARHERAHVQPPQLAVEAVGPGRHQRRHRLQPHAQLQRHVARLKHAAQHTVAQ